MAELPKSFPADLLAKLTELGIDTNDFTLDPEGFPKGAIKFGQGAVVMPMGATDEFVDKLAADFAISSVFDKLFGKPKKSGLAELLEGIFGNMGEPYKFEDGIIAEPVPEPEVKVKKPFEGIRRPPRAERQGVGVKGGTQRPPTPVRQPYDSNIVPFETTDNGVALREHGLSVVHIHKGDYPHAGMTVCYRIPNKYESKTPSDTIELSTAIVHPNDRFDRKVGTATAITNFQAGRTIILPLIKGMTIPETLEMYFEPVAMRRPE